MCYQELFLTRLAVLLHVTCWAWTLLVSLFSNDGDPVFWDASKLCVQQRFVVAHTLKSSKTTCTHDSSAIAEEHRQVQSCRWTVVKRSQDWTCSESSGPVPGRLLLPVHPACFLCT